MVSLSFTRSTVDCIDVELSIVTSSADAIGIIKNNRKINNSNIFFMFSPPLIYNYLKIDL